jgi:flagellar L-ring protein precursor FlgH
MKTIQTDEEEQSVILSGVCRAEDITADNTVLSTQLHDLTVRKTHKGAVRDTTKRGWIPRLLDVLNPF